MAREKALDSYRLELEKEKPDVLMGACYIAQAEYPDLDPADCVRELDRLAGLVAKELPVEGERYPLRIVQAISRVLYGKLGFEGNEDNYYDPDNSYINCVLKRRTGLPITMSLVYMEVARRVGLEMVGVNLPGHFMVRPAVGELEVLVDAFRSGEVCCLEDVQALLSGVMGVDVRLDPQWMRILTPLPARKFLMRVLNNLKQLYRSGDGERLLRVIRYMRLTYPGSPLEVRDEGKCLYAMARLPEAAALLAQYLQMAPDAEDAPAIRQLLDKISYLQSLNRGDPGGG